MSDLINIEAFELDKGVYYIELPQSGNYEIDGIVKNISWNETKVIVDLDNKPEIFKINEHSKIKEYKNQNNEILPLEEYNKIYSELYAEDFVDIDAEYNYKKFVQTWKAQYESFVIKTKINYEIKYNVYNLPKYITPMRKLNGDLKSTVYIYDQAKHILELVEKSLLKIGYIKSTRESTLQGEFYLSKDNIRFSKIDKGQYLTIRVPELRKYEEKGIYKDTYEKVFNLYNSNIQSINSVIEIWNRSQILVDKFSYNDLLTELKNIKQSIIGISVKASDKNKRPSLNKVEALIDKIENELREKQCL